MNQGEAPLWKEGRAPQKKYRMAQVQSAIVRRRRHPNCTALKAHRGAGRIQVREMTSASGGLKRGAIECLVGMTAL